MPPTAKLPADQYVPRDPKRKTEAEKRREAQIPRMIPLVKGGEIPKPHSQFGRV